MASIKLILRCDKTNIKTGTAPLYLRIIKDRKTTFISLGQQIDPKYWEEDKQKVKKSFPNSARMNAFLAQKVAETQEKVLEESQKNRDISTKKLKISIVGKEPPKFFEFAYKRLENVRISRKFNTYQNYLNALKKFERFEKNKNLYFDEITLSYLKDYEQYLLSELKNSANSIKYAFSILGYFFNLAMEEELIPLMLNPFQRYKIKQNQIKKDYLNEEQFAKLLGYKPKHPTAQAVYDMFLFSAYAGGLRFSDVISLKWENYNPQERRILIVVEKTNRSHQFRLPEQAILILENYKHAESLPTDYIFPFYNVVNELANNPKAISFKIRTISTKVNFHLHKISKEIELPFKLSFHIARHTFATRALSKGMRIEYVSKILGHSSIQQTQVYAKIINSDLDKAMDIVFAN